VVQAEASEQAAPRRSIELIRTKFVS